MTTSLDLLQGSWAVASLEIDGQRLPKTMHAGARITIAGTRFSSTGIGAVYEGTVRIEEPVAPARHGHIDLAFEAGAEAGNTNVGIFEIGTGSWRLCLATRGAVRPEAFATLPGTGLALETLIRPEAAVSPPASPRTTKPATTQDPAASGLQGTWTMVSGIVDGIAMDPSMVQWVRRVTKGSQTTVMAGPQVLMKFEVTCDNTVEPHTIDYFHTAGPSQGKTQAGIYRLDGDTLTVHTAAPGAKRPTDYELAPSTKASLTVWKRE